MRHHKSDPWLVLSRWLCALVLLGGLASTHAAQQVQQLDVDLAGQRFALEYVADPESRRQGLMGRETLAHGTGMLFDFPEGTQPAIWMRNMVISLDLLYLNKAGEIVQIFANVPPCRAMPCEIYHAREPLRFVLEVPAGTADRIGLMVGQTLALDGLIDQPAPLQ